MTIGKIYFFAERTPITTYAPCAIFAPSLISKANVNVFKKSDEERLILNSKKKAHQKELKKHYGEGWKKHLNIPSKSLPHSLHITKLKKYWYYYSQLS